jgi:hypothetical protein
LPGEERPVLFRQGRHFGHFFSSPAQAVLISAFTDLLASLYGQIGLRPPQALDGERFCQVAGIGVGSRLISRG